MGIKIIIAAFFLCALGAVAGESIAPSVVTQDFRCWHNIPYGPRGNLPDEGAGFKGRIGNWKVPGTKWRMATHKTGQFLDIYAPTNGARASSTVVLFLHGGSWSQPFDKDAIPAALVDELLARGAVVASAGYIMQTDNTINVPEDGVTKAREGATFDAMLRDIDAAASKLKKVLPLVGVDEARLVMAGESAGAHLALLYSYDQGAPERLGLGLKHEFPVSKVVSIVGPTDLVAIDGAKGRPTESYAHTDLKYRFRILFKRLVGLPDDGSDAELEVRAKRWSPVGIVSEKSVPTVLAYGQIMPFVKTDGVVPLDQMTILQEALGKAGVACEAKSFMGSNHIHVAGDGAEWIAEKALAE